MHVTRPAGWKRGGEQAPRDDDINANTIGEEAWRGAMEFRHFEAKQ
jgi:hypothetical protein